MSVAILITRAGPLLTVQDEGRFGMLAHGASASGPMDRLGYAEAGQMLGGAPAGGIEITMAGMDCRIEGARCVVGMAGGQFKASHNGKSLPWPGRIELAPGDDLSVTPGPSGNYGYLRFGGALDLPMVMGSISTNSRAGLGGLDGRPLRAGDRLTLKPAAPEGPAMIPSPEVGPVRFVWGLHADLFPSEVRQRFVTTDFTISTRLDRMGVRLDDPEAVFAGTTTLSLVSDAIVPGDIQILGDGTPTVLMRDHQPTGGYPRIATVIGADLDRFAQMRPGSSVAFRPVSIDHAHRLLRRPVP